MGGWIVAFCAFLFGYTTLIGWAYYGEQFLEYVFGPRVTVPYRWVYCGLIVLRARSGKVDLVWAWGDLMNGLQIFPNLVGVIGLSGVAAAALRDSERKPAACRRARMTGFAREDGVLSCDGVSLEDAARAHGTPLYVYSRAAIARPTAPTTARSPPCRIASATR